MPKARRATSMAKKAARALAGPPTSGSCLSRSIYRMLSSHCLASAILLGSTSRPQTPTNAKPSDDVIIHQVIPLTRTTQSKKRLNNPAPTTPYKRNVSSSKKVDKKDHECLEGNIWHSNSPVTPRIVGGAQAAFRQATAAAWVKLLPKLVYPLMAWAQQASEQHARPVAGVPEVSACKCGGIQSSCYVSVISFQSKCI